MRDRDGAYVAQTLVDGQFLFAADAQRFVEFAAGLQHVGDLAVRDRDGAYVAQALVDGQFLFAADAQRFVEFAETLAQARELIQQRQPHVIGCVRL